MSDEMNKNAAQDDSVGLTPEGTSEETSQARKDHALQQRRRILKAAALAAPLLITLRARSAYAQASSGTVGLGYGTYSKSTTSKITSSEGAIPAPSSLKKKHRKNRWW